MDQKTTEQSSNYEDLEKMSTSELLKNMNAEDKKVPDAIEKIIPKIEEVVDVIVEKISRHNGRLFYIGAGTSGRLGVLDASECPPTFGVSDNVIIGLIAGGDGALRKAVENAEDDQEQAWKDLQKFDANKNDVLLGIAASGSTPYVIGG
ncbi:MAG TPA: N-acetylmuramic acid 6-phosphate etherase, partial [Gillisia sp.]|nr:N-acetylmuramic acid 6-phosphate etherase [Gillisia sp.]